MNNIYHVLSRDSSVSYTPLVCLFFGTNDSTLNSSGNVTGYKKNAWLTVHGYGMVEDL